jgi:uncharacterized protein with HEPN domain
MLDAIAAIERYRDRDRASFERDIVWGSANRDVPALQPALQRFVRELEDRGR